LYVKPLGNFLGCIPTGLAGIQNHSIANIIKIRTYPFHKLCNIFVKEYHIINSIYFIDIADSDEIYTKTLTGGGQYDMKDSKILILGM